MTASKIVLGAAGAAGGAGLDVDEVFSTYLYDGNGSTQTVTNGIDLSGEGGLVWIKNRTRTSGADHVLVDTERGANYWLMSSSTSAQFQVTGALTSFNSNGFSQNNNHAETNLSGEDFVSWTLRKAPRFFDVVTYSGTGSAQSINHSLGQSPGMIIIKSTSNAENWQVWHRSVTGNLELDGTSAVNSSSIRITAVSSTDFTLGTFNTSNGSGQTYVAYLFAHNNNDGGFGTDADQDIIKCGSYTGTGASQEINLGFEAQWLLIKNTTNAQSWAIIDNMRGFTVEGVNDEILTPDDNSAEAGDNRVFPTASGFGVHTTDYRFNGSGSNYIYMAIRRGPLSEPTSASDVFAMDTGANSTPSFDAGFPVDAALVGRVDSTDKWYFTPRLTGSNYLDTSSTAAEASSPAFGGFDYQTQYYGGNLPSTYQAWMWKRAPSYFDVVAYTGDSPGGVGAQTISHNLGVAPEMIWFKRRDSTSGWGVLVTALGTVDSGGVQLGQGAYLNETGAFVAASWWGSPYVAPTATEFTVRGSTPNASGGDYIAYLFATLAGVSKVGNFTTTGSDVNVDCGFSSGARFVLWKRTDSASSWNLMDSERGIVAGNDPFLNLNQTSAENNTVDLIDPYSSGFTVAGGGLSSGGTYIFYAIAA